MDVSTNNCKPISFGKGRHITLRALATTYY